MKTKNFTLLELLIVVAVIAILAALLMPALQSALAQGRQIACTSIMKTLGLANTMYLNDNQGVIYVGRGSDYETAYSASDNGACDFSSIPSAVNGTSKIPCKYYPYAGVALKKLCIPVVSLMQERNPTKYVNCESKTSVCAGHVHFFSYYSMRIELGSTTGGCFIVKNGSENVAIHKPERIATPSKGLFWSEGLSQLKKKSYVIADTRGLDVHKGKTNVLYFDGHAGNVTTQKVYCEHEKPAQAVASCEQCRFWFPYKEF